MVMVGVLAVAAVTAPAATAGTATAPGPTGAPAAVGPVGDMVHAPDLERLRFRDEQGRLVDAATFAARLAESQRSAASARALAGPAEVGTQRQWFALDFVAGVFYLKTFVLRGVGEHIEVWTAEGLQASPEQPETQDLDFLPGDCRNGPRTEVTDEQVDHLVAEFDTTIYPAESAAFSTPPDRDGGEALLGPETGLDFTGEGDKIVTLVDNVRDESFYDLDNSQTQPYVAGFFSDFLNELTDRNVMTIDGYDWLHRTGPNPPDEPSADPCTNAPARPYAYEATFAHEYQHLLESYEDPDEAAWVNEGLAMYAETVTGYSALRGSVFQPRYEGHVQCFLGYLRLRTPYNTIPSDECGPSNSLTLWGDQGQEGILADYGAAWTMMEYLGDRFGPDFLSQLHRADGNGLEGLQDVLDAYAPGTDVMDVLHDWAAMVALDRPLDRGARLLAGADPFDFRSESLSSSVLWSNPRAYLSGDGGLEEGAPPNGGDYVRLADERGRSLSVADLEEVTFQGSPLLAATPVEWSVDEAPAGHDSAALHSGTGDNLDRSIAREVTVPADDPTLTFDTRWSIEEGWDAGAVQVSVDGGETWTSLGNDDTTSEFDPGAVERVVEHLPAFTGERGWTTTTFDLSAYAGRTVLLGFRYLSDPAVTGEGWWVDDVAVGGTVLSDGTSLEGWRTYRQIDPDEVEGFTVQVFAYSDLPRTSPVAYARLDLGDDLTGSLDVGAFLRGVRTDLRYVAAVVTQDDRSETVQQYAPYRLVVNGVVQPGGGEMPATPDPDDPRV